MLSPCFTIAPLIVIDTSSPITWPSHSNQSLVVLLACRVVSACTASRLPRVVRTTGCRSWLIRMLLSITPRTWLIRCTDEFKVLLSQRRRWINSTVHNLMELVLVRDLCGTFCFSMQFVVFIELIGTLVLPAAIAFTFYLSKPPYSTMKLRLC